MRRRVLCLGVGVSALLLIGALVGHTDTVVMHDGQQIACQIVAETTDTLEVLIGTIPAVIPLAEVVHIERSLFQQPPRSSSAPVVTVEGLLQKEEFVAQCLRTEALDTLVAEAFQRRLTIRLAGVELFEEEVVPTSELAQLLTGSEIVVRPAASALDASGALVAEVLVGNPRVSVNTELVRRGWAQPQPGVDSPALNEALASAKQRRLGYWQQFDTTSHPGARDEPYVVSNWSLEMGQVSESVVEPRRPEPPAQPQPYDPRGSRHPSDHDEPRQPVRREREVHYRYPYIWPGLLPGPYIPIPATQTGPIIRPRHRSRVPVTDRAAPVYPAY